MIICGIDWRLRLVVYIKKLDIAGLKKMFVEDQVRFEYRMYKIFEWLYNLKTTSTKKNLNTKDFFKKQIIAFIKNNFFL